METIVGTFCGCQRVISLWGEEKKPKHILWITHSPSVLILGYVNTIFKAHFEGTQDASHTLASLTAAVYPLD